MDITMCEYMRWNTVFQVGSHYYSKLFAKNNNKVTWINQPLNLIDVYKDKKNIKYLKGGAIGSNSDNITEYSPLTLVPFCKYPVFNTKLCAKYYLNTSIPNISKQLNKNINTDILWMTNVKMYELSNKIKYNFMIHRMADDFSAFSGAYKNMIYLEQQVIKKSDMVIVTAKPLIERAKENNKNVVYIPNGVDFSRFENQKPEIPEEYKAINGPKIVYVGAIDDWFDFELISEASKRLKEFAFIIIGTITDKARAVFSDSSNIHLLGRKNHNDIFKYLKHADIGVIPFIDNKLTNSIHPLKLYEYCAAGIPVLSRSLEEVRYMNSPARLYTNVDEFCDQTKSLIDEEINKDKLIDYARSNSWESRYKMIMEHIKQL